MENEDEILLKNDPGLEKNGYYVKNFKNFVLGCELLKEGKDQMR